MGGICGIVFRDREATVGQLTLEPMVQALDMAEKQRGTTASFGRVGFAAQGFNGSLAGVLDLSIAGKSLALAVYGSFYNMNELRAERQDPLVGLLHFYSQEGMNFLQRLRGDFALALWDGAEETLYLVTDRFRVRPLFYYQDKDKLVFASRMKGITACPLPLNCSINAQSIVNVVTSSKIPTPRTIFREVQKVPAGHILAYRKGETRVDPYWDIDFVQKDHASEKELAQKLKSRFAEAVSLRLQTDGVSDRLGTFLSGGVDSSTVTGVLSQLAERSIKSFSIGFDEQNYNEIAYARVAARAFGSKHYEHFVSPRETYEAIPVLLKGFDEPYGNASAVPTYFCAKMARDNGVDVLYAGDGGDELFAGNERYTKLRLYEYYQWIPRWIREPLVKPVVFNLADRLNWRLLAKGKKYIQLASATFTERSSSPKRLGDIPLSELFEGSFLETVERERNLMHGGSLYGRAPAVNDLDRWLYVDLKVTITDNDLFKVTRMTEAAGVAVRFPFLDHYLAEFAAKIPAGIKMRGRNLRSFFKSAYADLLPVEVRLKKKHGFGLPIPIWLRTDKQLNELMRDLVLSPRSIQRGYFRKKGLEELVERHKTDETSYYGTALWHLMMLELWHRNEEQSLSRQ